MTSALFFVAAAKVMFLCAFAAIVMDVAVTARSKIGRTLAGISAFAILAFATIQLF